MEPTQSERRIARAIFNLALAGSVDNKTDVLIDRAEVVEMTGEPVEAVDAVIEDLVALGAADHV